MPTNKNSGNPENNENENEMDYQFIDENEIDSVKRGRKPRLTPELVAFFATAKVGQIVKLQKFALDPALYAGLDKATKEKNEALAKEILAEIKLCKSSVSAKIRIHALHANWKKIGIVWDKIGVPYAKRKA